MALYCFVRRVYRRGDRSARYVAAAWLHTCQAPWLEPAPSPAPWHILTPPRRKRARPLAPDAHRQACLRCSATPRSGPSCTGSACARPPGVQRLWRASRWWCPHHAAEGSDRAAGRAGAAAGATIVTGRRLRHCGSGLHVGAQGSHRPGEAGRVQHPAKGGRLHDRRAAGDVRPPGAWARAGESGPMGVGRWGPRGGGTPLRGGIVRLLRSRHRLYALPLEVCTALPSCLLCLQAFIYVPAKTASQSAQHSLAPSWKLEFDNGPK